jgi:autotransporter-associated beta strand protein
VPPGGGSNTIVASGASLTIGDNSINPGETLTLNGTGTANEGALRKIGTTNSNWTAAITLGSASRINSDTSGLLTISGAIGGGANNLTIGGTGNVTISSVVTTSGTFTKDGAGTLILSANNSAAMTGPVAINGGVVSIPLSTSLGTNAGTITLDGGTLRNTNGGSGGSFVNAARGLVIGANGGTVDYTTGTNTNSSIYAGTITGTGTLTKTGNGEFRYQGTGLPNTTYTKLVVNQGVFRLGFASSTADERGFGAVPGSFLADAITLNGGAIGSSFDVTLDANRGITLGPNGGTIYGVFGTGGAPITIPGAISGSGSLTLSPGTQQITLSGANTNSGTTTITTGTVAIGAANSLSSASAVTIASGGILNLAGFDQTVASLAGDGNVTRTTGALTTGGDNSSTTYTGVIDGSGAVTKAGSGTWTLTGVHTYTGATNINGGTLRLNSGSSLAAGSAVAVNSTATLTGTGTVNGSVTVNTGGTIAPGDAGVGTMTIGNGLTTGNGSTMFLKVTDASTEANDSTGGSTQGTLPNPTSNNFINVTGGSSAIDAGTNFIIDVTGQNFLHNRNYSYQIATVVGDMSGLNITNQAQFVDIGLITPDATYSITGGAGGQIYLNIHPVPEPATVLGLAAGVLAAGGFIRRRVVRRA